MSGGRISFSNFTRGPSAGRGALLILLFLNNTGDSFLALGESFLALPAAPKRHANSRAPTFSEDRPG